VSSAPSTQAASATPGPNSIAGTWKGTYASEGGGQGDFTIVFTMLDSTTVSGRITITNGCIHDGTISGAITGSTINFGKVESTNDVGAVSFTGTVSGDNMSGTYNSNAACGNDHGVWQAARS